MYTTVGGEWQAASQKGLSGPGVEGPDRCNDVEIRRIWNPSVVEGRGHQAGKAGRACAMKTVMHDLRILDFTVLCDLELLKDFKEKSDRIEFAFGKISLIAYWKIG